MMHFDWMVFDHIDKQGIWFKSTMKGIRYIFFWNPFTLLKGWLTRGLYLGMMPLSIKHINKKAL